MRYFTTKINGLLIIVIYTTLVLTGCANQEIRPVTTPLLEGVKPSEIIEKEKVPVSPGSPPFSETYLRQS